VSLTDSQLTLDLFCAIRHDFAAYHAGPNAVAVSALEHWCADRGPRVVYLWGAAGTGKTHLLQAAVRAVSEAGTRAMYVPLAELADAGPAILDGLDRVDTVALDDVGACAGRSDWEERLFVLYNAVHDSGGRLLWSGVQSPATAFFKLGDLRSRLAASLIYQLRELDDAGKATVLTRLAAQRGLELPAAVIEFVLRRERRDMSALLAVLDKLDQASLSRGRALTVPFVREVLAAR
jgi:DnaA-homolog protein